MRPWCMLGLALAACNGGNTTADVAVDRTLPDSIDATNPMDTLDAPDAVDAGNDLAPDATDVAPPPDVFDVVDAGSDGGLDAVDFDATWIPYGDAGCSGRIRPTPLQPALHVDPDAGPIVWFTDPPSSGPHYPIWAHWGAFPNIPPGYWVHNLEHGGVVFLYRCPAGPCDATVAQLQAVAASLPDDTACMVTDATPVRDRLVITSYPIPDAAYAAVAWGWIYEADCIDPAALRHFFVDHHGMAPEDFCFDGFYP